MCLLVLIYIVLLVHLVCFCFLLRCARAWLGTLRNADIASCEKNLEHSNADSEFPALRHRLVWCCWWSSSLMLRFSAGFSARRVLWSRRDALASCSRCGSFVTCGQVPKLRARQVKRYNFSFRVTSAQCTTCPVPSPYLLLILDVGI